MAVYFMNNDQRVIKVVGYEALREVTQTQELPDDGSLLKDMLTVSAMNDERLDDAQYMAVESYKGNKQSFDMYRIVNQRTEQNWTTFDGVQLAYYELAGAIIEDIRPKNAYINELVPRLLKGTDWTLGYVDDNLPEVSTHIYYLSVKDALAKVQNATGVEMIFKVEISGNQVTDKWVEVYERLGDKTLKRFNYGTNALTVVRETSHQDLYTALIGRGKGEEVSSAEDNQSGQAGYGRKITFRDVEWSKANGKPLDKPKGQLFLERPEATKAYGIQALNGEKLPRVGIVEFSDTENPNVLIQQTYEALEYYARPKVLFKASVVNIGATGIGDTVTIHRHDLNIHYQTRVRKVIRDKINDNRTQVELGDVVHTSSTKKQANINSALNNLDDTIRDTARNEILPSLPSASGVNQNFYQNTEPERKRTGDLWYRDHPSLAGHRQLLMWNGEAWELLADTSDTEQVKRLVEEQEELLENFQSDFQTIQERNEQELAELNQSSADLTDSLAQVSQEFANLSEVYLPSRLDDIRLNIDAIRADTAEETARLQSEMLRLTGNNESYIRTVRNELTGELAHEISLVRDDIPTEVGGRNLIPDSHFYSGQPNGWNPAYGTQEVVNHVLIKEFISSMRSSRIERVFKDLEIGQTYTLSAYVKSEVPLDWRNFVNAEDVTKTEHAKIDEWYVDHVTFTATDTSVTVRGYVSYVPFGSKVYIDWFKLEKGNIATDWTPAPEDIFGEFDTVRAEYTAGLDGLLARLSKVDDDLQNFKQVEFGMDEDSVHALISQYLEHAGVDGLASEQWVVNQLNLTVDGLEMQLKDFAKVTDLYGLATEQYAEYVSKEEANRVERQLTNYARKTDLNGLATESYTQQLVTATSDSFKRTIAQVEKEIPESYENRNLAHKGVLAGDSSGYTRSGDIFTLRGRRAGIRIMPDTFEANTSYVMSFKFRKVSGTVRNMAGHAIGFNTDRVVIDGKVTGDNWSPGGSNPVPNDTDTHTVEVYLHLGNSSQTGVYIQPNRITYSDDYVLDIWDLQLEKGTKATPWSPAPEDVQTAITEVRNDYIRDLTSVTDRLTKVDGANGSINQIKRDLTSTSNTLASLENNALTRINTLESTVDGTTRTIANLETGMASQINQLAGQIDLRVRRDDLTGIISNSGDAILAGLKGKGGDMIAELNLSAGGARLAGKNIYLDSNVTYTNSFVSNVAQVMELSADQITTGTLNAANVRIINLDVNSITGNITNFIQSYWNSAAGGNVRITGSGIQSTAPDNSQTLIQNGVVLARQSSGSTIGYIGHNPDTPSPFYTISTTLGSNFSLRSLTSRGWENIIEIYPESSDMWLSADRTRVTGRLRANSIIMEGDVGMAGYNIQNISTANFQYGSWIYDDYRNSGLRVVGGSDIRWYTGGVMSGSDMGMRMSNSHVLMHRTLSMEGNSITNQSDERLKRNIMPSFKDSLGRFNKAKFKWFEYLPDHNLAGGLHHGLIAQEVLEYAPEWVLKNEQGYYSLNQSTMLIDAFKAIQQLSQKVKKLEAQLNGRTI